MMAMFRNLSRTPTKRPRSAKTAVTVVAVDDDRGLFVGVLDKFLNIAIMKMQRAGDMRRAIRSRIANIDKHGRFLFQLLFRLMYLDLGNIYHRSHSSLVE